MLKVYQTYLPGAHLDKFLFCFDGCFDSNYNINLMAHDVTFVQAPRYVLRKFNLLRMIKNLDIETFLDIGCGAGELACTLSEQGLYGQGIDFSAEAITQADAMRKSRDIDSAQLSFKVGDLHDLDKTYDLDIACEVLEHVKDDRRMLKDIVASANKYVLVSVPAKQKLYDESDKAVGHYRRYERDDLQELLRSAGLEIVEFINYGFPFTHVVRLLRKSAFKKKLAANNQDKPESRSKDSGINPVRLPAIASHINPETAMWGFYQMSRLANNTDLGEGYVALCRKISSVR